MQFRGQNGQTKGVIIKYNGILCKTYESEVWIKIMDHNQV